AALEGRGTGLEVDLGLAAAGLAVEQEVPAPAAVEGGLDARQRGVLRLGQLADGLVERKALPVARRRLLLAPLPLQRRDQLERAPRRRAVVVGDPEGEVDEGRRQLVDDRLDREGIDPVGRLVDDRDDDAALSRATE